MTLLGRLSRHHPMPPTVVITGAGDIAGAVQAMRLGASDYLPKPLNLDNLRRAIDEALPGASGLSNGVEFPSGHDATADNEIVGLVAQLASAEHADAIIHALVTALDAREKESAAHSRRVSRLATLLGRRCGISPKDLTDLVRGALLHDVGKIGIPDQILLKPGPLSPAEWSIMRRHPEIGARIVSKIDYLRPVTPLVMHHHERFDGTGYPLGLSGDRIPLAARIYAVVDAVDAMLGYRVYRLPLTVDEVIGQLCAGRGKQFDPEVTTEFLTISTEEWTTGYSAATASIRERVLQ
jgi:response regulator RpfG family c-di-GMP phosphodiesterase